MIDLYYAPTPNGWKISIMLEELGLPYDVKPVNIRTGEQFSPEFLAVSPNNRIPAIVDHAPADGGAPFSAFETGAILIYLAEKTGRFLASDLRGRSTTIQGVMWQMAGLGPMLDLDGVVYESRGKHGLRNVAEPVEIFAALWASDVGADELPIDPVCRMAVDPDRAAGRLTHEGTVYYFCSLPCAGHFASYPERFARATH